MRKFIDAIAIPVGTILGAASVISLISNYENIELAQVAADAVSTYRAMMAVFRDLLFSWWTPIELFNYQVTVPLVAMDVLALWLTASLARYRAELYDRMELRGRAAEFPWLHRGIAAKHALFWFPLAPLGWAMFVRHQVLRIVGWERENANLRNQASRGMREKRHVEMRVKWNRHKSWHEFVSILVALLVPVFVVGFFVWNAVQLR